MLGIRDIVRGRLVPDQLLPSLHGRLDVITTQHDVLATVFRRIEPFGGRRRGRPAKRLLEDILRDSFGVLESDVREIGVQVELPTSETTVTVDQPELQEVFVNLLGNSLYWLRQVPAADRRIRVEIRRDDDGVQVLFSDWALACPTTRASTCSTPTTRRSPTESGSA